MRRNRNTYLETRKINITLKDKWFARIVQGIRVYCLVLGIPVQKYLVLPFQMSCHTAWVKFETRIDFVSLNLKTWRKVFFSSWQNVCYSLYFPFPIVNGNTRQSISLPTNFRMISYEVRSQPGDHFPIRSTRIWFFSCSHISQHLQRYKSILCIFSLKIGRNIKTKQNLLLEQFSQVGQNLEQFLCENIFFCFLFLGCVVQIGKV